MSRELLKKIALATLAGLSLGLAGCLASTDNGFDPSKPNNGAGANNGQGECPQGYVLDGAQCTLTGVVGDLAGALAGTPLEGLVSCLDPTANDVLDGADPLVTNLLDALANQNVDPAAVQSSATALAGGLASVGENVPNAVLALSGNQEALAACQGAAASGGSGGGGSSSPLSPAALCALPGVGPQIAGAAGADCAGGGSTSPLDPSAVCAIPTLGPVLAGVAGADCGGAGGGGGTALPGGDQLAALCAIPTLGPTLVGAAGGNCADAGSGGSPVDPSAVCSIPTLGPILAGVLTVTCP